MKLFVIEPIFPSSVEKKRNLMEKVKQQQLGKKNETKTKKKKISKKKRRILCFYHAVDIERSWETLGQQNGGLVDDLLDLFHLDYSISNGVRPPCNGLLQFDYRFD